MTRLINFGLGEIIDRLTILGLKIAHLPSNDATAFETERRQLISMIPPNTADTIPEWADLAQVNNALWQAEDKMRAYRERPQLTTHDLFDVAALGMQCQALNDDRAQLIASINQSQGDQHVEKRAGGAL